MSVQLDPEQNETAAFFKISGDFAGKRVLEVGSGDGRLTWLYADRAAAIVGVEPDESEVRRARQDFPRQLRRTLRFFTGSLEQYADRRRKRFDLAILSWSL